MKAIVKLFTSDGDSEKGFPIKLVINHKYLRKRKIIAHSLLVDWDPVKQLPRRSHPDYETLYSKILNMRLKANKVAFTELSDVDKAFKVLLVTNSSNIRPEMDFYAFAEKSANQMEELGRPGNAKVYRTAAASLKNFMPFLNFSEITDLQIKQWAYELQRNGLKNSSIRNYISTIRAIYNKAVRYKLTTDNRPFDRIMKEYPVRRRRANNRYLDYTEIQKLETAVLPAAMRRAADLALLQFHLCGADFTDIFHLTTDQIQNGRVFLKRSKLGDRGYEFDVLLTPKAKEIIDKYQDPVKKEGKEYLFSWIKYNGQYETFRSNHNRALRKIKMKLDLKTFPKDGRITTKTMRHTFATLGKFARIEEDLLRELMGHERNDIDTIYKDKYPEEERDLAQLKIIDVTK